MSSLNHDQDLVAKKISQLAGYLFDLSRKKTSVGIFPHARADADALGAALSLAIALRALGAEVEVIAEEKAAPSLQFLPQVQSIVLYSNAMALKQFDLAVAVDLNTPDRLEKRERLFLNASRHAIVDHHVRDQEQGENELIYTGSSSTCELMFQLISVLETLSARKIFNDDIAVLLISGMMTDTGRFSYSNTTPLALRQMARLIEDFNVDLAFLTHELFERTTVTQLQIRGDVLASIKLAAGGRILYASVPREMMNKRKATDDHLDYLSSDMREADGVDVSILLRESPDRSEIHGSVRSNSCLNAAEFAQVFGGGGHVRASGFTIAGMSLAEAEAEVVAQAEKMLEQCS
ncbi:MAG: hypothetical protein GX681_01515 [Clostridiaceae bacterium]|nr:hypothetical protein [Clostridiaceae bacterium]